MTGAIPISDAKDIGARRQCPVVVIFAIEESGERYTITTWGKTKPLCGWAARISEEIHDAVMDGEVLDAAHADDPYREIERLQAELAERDTTLRSIAAQTACRCGPEWTRYGCHAPGCRFEISMEAMEALGEGTEAKEGEA